MPLRRAIFFGALTGTISAFAIYALVGIIEASKSLLPASYASLGDAFCFYAPFMLWPAGSEFLFEIEYMHIPVLSLTYFDLLLRAILLNAVEYSVIAAVFWLCWKVAKVAVLIPILAVLLYWMHLINR